MCGLFYFYQWPSFVYILRFGLWFILSWEVVGWTGEWAFSHKSGYSRSEVTADTQLPSPVYNNKSQAILSKIILRLWLLYCTKKVKVRIGCPQTFPHGDIYFHETKSASQYTLPFPTLPCTQAVCTMCSEAMHIDRVSICQHRQKDDTSITQCKSMSGCASCHTARIWQMATRRKRPTSTSTQAVQHVHSLIAWQLNSD